MQLVWLQMLKHQLDRVQNVPKEGNHKTNEHPTFLFYLYTNQFFSYMKEELFLLLIYGDLLQQPGYYYQTLPDSDGKQMNFLFGLMKQIQTMFPNFY